MCVQLESFFVYLSYLFSFPIHCSCSLEKLKVYPNTYVLLVQILARDECYAELGLFIMNKVTFFLSIHGKLLKYDFLTISGREVYFNMK